MATYTDLNGGQQWSGLGNAPKFHPVAMIAYDTFAGAFRPLTTADITGTVSVVDSPSNSVSNSVISGSNGISIYTNQNRKLFYVQNLSTGNSLYVKLGTGASAVDFNYILKKDTGTDDGAGGTLTESNWRGNVSTSGSAFVRYIAWELT